MRLRREEAAALDFLARYCDMNKGDVVSKLIIEENRRLASLIVTDPEARARFARTPPPGK